MFRFITKLAVSTAFFFLCATAGATPLNQAGALMCAHPESEPSAQSMFEVVPFMSFASRYGSEAVEPSLEGADSGYPGQYGSDAVAVSAVAYSPGVAPNRLKALTSYALAYLGNRYKYGGNNPSNGIDCSGFVKYVFNKVGVELPRTAYQQAGVGLVVPKADLKLGDLVFFNTLGRSLSHVGIYLGNGDFVHASGTKRGIIIDTMNSGYFSARFEGGRSIR